MFQIKENKKQLQNSQNPPDNISENQISGATDHPPPEKKKRPPFSCGPIEASRPWRGWTRVEGLEAKANWIAGFRGTPLEVW